MNLYFHKETRNPPIVDTDSLYAGPNEIPNVQTHIRIEAGGSNAESPSGRMKKSGKC